MEIGPVIVNNYVSTTTQTKTPIQIQTQSKQEESSVKQYKPRVWTNEEYREASLKYLNGEDFAEKEAYFAEKHRHALLSSLNYFEATVRDFSIGAADREAYETRAERSYDTDIFKKLAATFYGHRNAYVNNYRGYLTDEEVDYQLEKLYNDFNKAIESVANSIQRYTNKNVINDIKSYGEAIKFYVSSGNKVTRDDDTLLFYEYLNQNVKTSLSLNEINKIGKDWFKDNERFYGSKLGL